MSAQTAGITAQNDVKVISRSTRRYRVSWMTFGMWMQWRIMWKGEGRQVQDYGSSLFHSPSNCFGSSNPAEGRKPWMFEHILEHLHNPTILDDTLLGPLFHSCVASGTKSEGVNFSIQPLFLLECALIPKVLHGWRPKFHCKASKRRLWIALWLWWMAMLKFRLSHRHFVPLPSTTISKASCTLHMVWWEAICTFSILPSLMATSQTCAKSCQLQK